MSTHRFRTTSKYELIQKARLDERARLCRLRYYMNPNVERFACARALFIVALEESEEAASIYVDVVQAWDLPGCQALADEAIRHQQSTRLWGSRFIKAMEHRVPCPELPTELFQVIRKYEDNTDLQLLTDHASTLVLKGFNRKIDLDNEAPKVLPEKAQPLVYYIVYRSLIDWCELELEKPGYVHQVADKYRVLMVAETGKSYQIEQIMYGDPTTRDQRTLKRNIHSTFKSYGFVLCHYDKLLGVAEAWYKSRIAPGSIESYLNELALAGRYVDRARIENDIALCDEITGWPRKWRTRK